MSEYQYFDFQTIDDALTPRQQESLRQVSSRATITARRFCVAYSFGNFVSDEDALMDRYFDAGLHIAN